MKLFPCLLLLIPFLLSGCTTIAYNTARIFGNKLSVGTQIDDEVVEGYAMNELDRLHLPEQNNITITSYNRMLLLTGQVQTQAIRMLVANRMSHVREVTKVYNYLTVGKEASAGQWAKDAYITSKVKSSILFSKASHFHFDVHTESGVVYLMGKAKADEEQYVLKRVSKLDGVKRVVPIFIVADPEKAPILSARN